MAPPQPTPSLTLYEITNQERLRNYHQALANGTYRPFIYPWDSLPALWLLLALLILPRLPQHVVKHLRLPTFFLILGHCICVGRSCRTIGLTGGYGIGLSATWGCIMSAALLLFNDLKTDFKRLEVQTRTVTDGPEKQVNGSATSTSLEMSTGELRRRQDATSNHSPTTSIETSTAFSQALVWHGYPSTLVHSLDWSLDLATAFRGVNWNFRNPTLPPLSSNITSQPPTSSPSALRQFRLNALRDFITLYLLVDIIKALCVADPYFLGLAPVSSPSPYALLHPYPTLTRLLRLVLALASTNIVLSFIFTLSPLLFPLLPQSITHTPLHNAEIYPPYFSPLSAITHSGLAGFWGKCWHQMFRFGISQPGLYLTRHFNWDRKSNKARTIQLFTAFLLSGVIHASASYTSFPPNDNVQRPLAGPLAFFVSQALGIMVQDFGGKAVKGKGVPDMLRKIGNVVFTAVWLYVTGPLLSDDFARCGVWLFEPVPISFIRGVRGEGWWKWGGRWAGWNYREEWWLRGLGVY